MLVLIYAPPEVRLMGLAMVFEMFDAANALSRARPRYQLRMVTDTMAPLRTNCGLTLVPDVTLAESDETADLLIVAASDGHAPVSSRAATDWLRARAAGAARYGAIGNGAFHLGAAGLLDGCRVAVYRDDVESLAARHPAARVEPDGIYVRDGRLFSCAGGFATADLILALVEEDHGRAVAMRLARRFVMFMRRSATQAQVSLLLSTQGTMQDPIQRVQQHILDHLDGDLSIPVLAMIAAMSPRNFSRVFNQETGLRPTVFVERTRVNMAKRLLEDSGLGQARIARMVGFSGTEAARRAFRRQTDQSMTDYRTGLPLRPGGSA